MYAELLRELIETLPVETVDYAFAYGSGAIPQANENMNEKTVDFILVSRDVYAFHHKNLQLNPHHYSTLRWVGAKNLSVLQKNVAARLYYNTLIKSKNGKQKFKYGVIAVDDLIADLLDWRWLYASGRLHKPVLNIIEPVLSNQSSNFSLLTENLNSSYSSIKNAIFQNRQSAVHAALLQLSDTFTQEELFFQIISLSYTGDFRMKFGEDRKKISKILHGALEKMIEIYIPIIASDPRISINGEKIIQDGSSQAIYHRLNLLPCEVLNGFNDFYKRIDHRERDVEEIVFSMAHRHDVAAIVKESISSIVQPAALKQTVLNGLSAGFIKSVMYSSSKILKMLKSLK